MYTPIRNRRPPRALQAGRVAGGPPTIAPEDRAPRREVGGIEPCTCHRRPSAQETILTLECLECAGGVVPCPHCGKPEWWADATRRVALNAAEAHRWQTGHRRVVARGFGGGSAGHIVREVGDE
jgi:hypothetical protein